VLAIAMAVGVAWSEPRTSVAKSNTNRSSALAGTRAPTARISSKGGAPVEDNTRFSNPPTDQEILVSGILPQPLAPVGPAIEVDENGALGRALMAYRDPGAVLIVPAVMHQRL
jgi:hypothetical protein